MSEYIDRIEFLFNRLDGMGSKFNESMQVATLITSFSSTSQSGYSTVITSLQTIFDVDSSWEKVTSILLQEYSTRRVKAPP